MLHRQMHLAARCKSLIWLQRGQKSAKIQGVIRFGEIQAGVIQKFLLSYLDGLLSAYYGDMNGYRFSLMSSIIHFL